jgi:CheY-like chemotaxis protein
MVESPHLKTMKTLVVHRQNKTVDQIKLVLSSCNPVVIYAESGLDGLLTSRIEHFDVIFCSTDLPVVTGFELVRSIRNNSVNRSTPVILLSEEMNEQTRHLSKSLGVLATLTTKEIDTLLVDIIETCVKTESDKPWVRLKKDDVRSDVLMNNTDWKQSSLEHSGPSLLPQA